MTPATIKVRSGACPICGDLAMLAPCYPGGDRVCPKCERLTQVVRQELAEQTALSLSEIRLESLLLEDLGLESLEDLIVLLAIEEKTGIKFVADLVESPSVRGIIASLRRQEQMESESARVANEQLKASRALDGAG